jgi:hypothetical protein
VYEERKAEEVWWVPTEDHPEGDRQFLTRPPGDGECEEVLKLIGRGKGTGPSGLPIELLVHAPMEVRQVVWSVVRTAFELGEMPESFKVANVFWPAEFGRLFMHMHARQNSKGPMAHASSTHELVFLIFISIIIKIKY